MKKWIQHGGIFFIKMAQWYSSFQQLEERDSMFLKILESFQNNSLQPITLSQKTLDICKSLQVVPIQWIASGSIANVYLGKWKNDQEVVIKIRHENIEQEIQDGLDILQFLIWSSQHLFKIDILQDIHDVYALFRSQTNLCIEASNNELFRKWYLKDESFLKIPKIYHAQKDLYIAEYIPSISNRDFEAPYHEKIEILSIMKCWILDQLFIHHTMHGDLHNGNWGITHDHKLVLYDLGYIFTDMNLSPQFFHSISKNNIESMTRFLCHFLSCPEHVEEICSLVSIQNQDAIKNFISILSLIRQKKKCFMNKRIAYMINFIGFIRNIHREGILKDFNATMEYNYLLLQKKQIMEEFRETILYQEFILRS